MNNRHSEQTTDSANDIGRTEFLCDRYPDLMERIAKAAPSASPVTVESHFFRDLKFDSIGFVQLLLQVEKQYSVLFTLAEMEQSLTVKHLFALLAKKLGGV